MTGLLPVPRELAGDDIGDAVELVRRYYDLSSPWDYFSGAMFERLDGGGDRPGIRNRITGADITAIGMLSVRIPSSARRGIAKAGPEIGALLREMPWDLDLVAADTGAVGPGSAADRLWQQLRKIDGIGWVTASKLLARKRPRLLPVYDRIVRQQLGRPKHFWASLQASLAVDDGALHRRLLTIRDAAGVGDDISPLRVFDVVCWRLGRASEGGAAGGS